MSMPDPGSVAAILEEGATWTSVVVPIAVALVAALVLDRALSRRGRDLAETVIRGGISPETGTRLRFIRRLLSAVVILLGVAIALSRVNGVDRLAASLLASGAIAAAILGFAARQTLANFVAGVMLAITQPLRVGDWVFFEDQYGVVDDIRLTYTFLRTLGGQRIVIPNEKLASGILRNDTLGEGAVGLDVHIWLPHSADAGRAVAVLKEATGQSVTVAETTAEGVRLAVGGERCPPPERAEREAELRLRCLELLRADGLLASPE
ncbi:MAG TPA: mechanosensitive ion channel domain-containing protein [Solirubrobacteraceae bacterium]|nr:mechanosensitive ion channel domain-containing protein [Solirubrobacteraceae bacterium]